MKELVKDNFKVVIIPWAFPVDMDSYTFNNEYFKKGEKRYNKYVVPLKELGISEKSIQVLDCYTLKKEEIVYIINTVDVIVIPGGNPEMLFKKVLHDTEIFYTIKHIKGIIIGESAGAELQLERYFITAKNNYDGYFAFYDGFGVIDDPFYMYVHSVDDKVYLSKLQEVFNAFKKLYMLYLMMVLYYITGKIK